MAIIKRQLKDRYLAKFRGFFFVKRLSMAGMTFFNLPENREF
jgi:hypothetical protein